MKSKSWTVYCHIAKDGRKYIGITSNNPKRRWDNGRGYKSNKLFYNYINKHGWNSIEHIIIKDNLCELEARQLEIELIKKHKTQNKKYGFNLTAGGDSGYSPCEETRKKMSIARRKRITSEITKLKISKSMTGEKNGFYGKHHTEETKLKLSISHKGKAGYFKGKKLTEEHKAKIGIKSLLRNAKPIRCVETGKEYNCCREAFEDLNIKTNSSICACCNKKRERAYGYHWEYI